MYKTVRFSDI